MLVRAIFAALRQVLSPPLRRLLWRSLALTCLILLFIWLALTRGVATLLNAHPISIDHPVVDGFVYFLSGAGLLVALAYAMPAISMVVASYFIDDAALVVEQTDFAHDRPGRAMPLGQAILYGLRFAALALFVNFCALVLFFVPGVNLVAFFVANTYLFGREYFEMAALRFSSRPEAARLREENRGLVLAAGAVMAGFVLIPVVNLATPLFGIALMVHLHKGVAARATTPVRRG